jgi:glycolate oxidase
MNQELIKVLKLIVGEDNLLLDPQKIRYASYDQSTNVKSCVPGLVVLVETREQLIQVTQSCIRFRTALLIRAAGTGKSGGAVPAHAKLVVIDISKLNKIIYINKENLIAELEPAVILRDFQERVEEHNLFYPPDPASRALCTIGGNVAENASGPSTLKYGCTRDYLLGGEAIIGNGDVINFGKRCPKGVAGYDIASLLCGSEGTLAVFTKFIVRLLPLPQDLAQGLFLFTDERQAFAAITLLFNNGHRPKILEYIDNTCLKALRKQSYLSFISKNTQAALLVECDASFAPQAQLQLEAIIKNLNALSSQVVIARNKHEQQELRALRSQLSEACQQYLGFKISEDVAVPLGELANFRTWFKNQEQKYPLTTALFGHAGDGNLHVQILFENEALRDQAQALRHEVLLYVLKLGGTLSAEHGIGLQKIAYLPLEQSAELIELQQRIKHAFDPYNLLNPGKIFTT